MLSNNADHFFRTPMRTRVWSGGNVGNFSQMPAPREASASAVGARWLPGVGDDTTPAAPAPASSNLPKLALIGGVTLLAWMLLK